MMTLTRAQRVALKTVFDRGPIESTPMMLDNYYGVKRWMTYREFRRTVQPEIGGAAVMVHWCGMWLGIETDGHVHS